MSKKTILIILLVLAVLCCCITTIVGGILFVSSRNVPFVTPTAITPTGTGGPLITTTRSATVTPSISLNQSIYDEFNDNKNGWTLGEEEGTYSTSNEYIQEGKLYLEFETISDDGAIVFDTLENKFVGDNYEVSLEGKLQDDSTNTTDYGIVFRMADKNNYYYFLINEHYQEFQISSKVGGEFVDITEDWVETTAISSTTPNKLKVVAEGKNYTFYINDVQVYTTTLSSIPSSGNVGVLGQSYEKADFGVIAFDKFSVSIK